MFAPCVFKNVPPGLNRRRLSSQQPQKFLDATFRDVDHDFEQLAADVF